MVKPLVAASAGVAMVTALAAAGIAWQDCLLIAASAVAGQRLFVAHMDRGAPWDAWRAALRSIEAGLLGLVAAAGLAAMAAAALLAWWEPQRADPTLLLTACAGLVFVAGRCGMTGAWAEVRAWSGLVVLTWLATWLAQRGLPVAPCVSVLLIAALLARFWWRLAHGTASDLMRGGQRLP